MTITRSGSWLSIPPLGPNSCIALSAIAATLIGVGTVGFVAHFRAPGHLWTLGLAAFAPYLMLAAPLGTVLFLIARQWIGLVVAVVALALCISTQCRLYVAQAAPANSVPVVEMTANLDLGGASAEDIVRAVRNHRVDLLAAQELTPRERDRLAHAGLDAILPFHVLDPRLEAQGTGLWSRYPIDSPAQRHEFGFALVTGRVTLPGIAKPIAVAALHMFGPVPNAVQWVRDINHLPSVLRELAASGSVLVGGDFNATSDVVQFRDLLTGGYQDAAHQSGAGLTPTYPSNRWYPPLIGIDHVLTNRAVATAAHTIEIPGSDHRALLVTVAVPRG